MVPFKVIKKIVNIVIVKAEVKVKFDGHFTSKINKGRLRPLLEFINQLNENIIIAKNFGFS